jgi:hypothetical protein
MDFRAIFFVAAIPLLSANTIPKLTVAQMTNKADLVATVRVTERTVKIGGQRCIAGVVLGTTKGHASGRIVICDNLIAEETPPRPAKGKAYAMYLARTGRQSFVPVSHGAFRRLD